MKEALFSSPYFIASVAFMLISIICFEFKKTSLSLVLLFVSSIFLGVFIALADPYIHIWDEQYHALVAKNLIENPFKPILIKDPVFGFEPKAWASGHVWLHKQPLFLWQMALSIKVFGLTELGVRLPSVIMHALMVFLVFRVGRLFFLERVGYYSALLYTFSYFSLEYISGSYSTDHSDTAFLFYSFASIWALIEYYFSNKKIFIILIALTAGGAILCKWLPGLLVYGIWMVLIYLNRTKKPMLFELKKFSFSLIGCCLVFLPWQIFCALNYPHEYGLSMEFNFRHMIEPLEGHGGDFLFYYNALYEQFGDGFLIPPLILTCFFYATYKVKDKNYKLIFTLTVDVTYLFFFFVKTKMLGYVFIALPLFIIGLAYTFNVLLQKISSYLNRSALKIAITNALLLGMLFLLLNTDKLYKRHTTKEDKRSRAIKIKEKEMYLGIKKEYGDEKCLIFNCTTTLNSHIISMFYTNFPSFNCIILPEQIDKAKSLGYKVLVIDNSLLPDNILHDSEISKINW